MMFQVLSAYWAHPVKVSMDHLIFNKTDESSIDPPDCRLSGGKKD